MKIWADAVRHVNDRGDGSGIWAVGITEAYLQMYFMLAVSTLVNEEVVVDAPLMIVDAPLMAVL